METKEMKRFRYEAPVIIGLGEMARGIGEPCVSGSGAPACNTNGTGPTGGGCTAGITTATCTTGTGGS